MIAQTLKQGLPFTIKMLINVHYLYSRNYIVIVCVVVYWNGCHLPGVFDEYNLHEKTSNERDLYVIRRYTRNKTVDGFCDYLMNVSLVRTLHKRHDWTP